MNKLLCVLLILSCPLLSMGQSVEVQGQLKVSEMDTINTENHLVVKRSDGTFATRMVASLPAPADTSRSLQSDLLLTSALCNCPSLPPAMIQSLLDNGYTNQDLIDFQIPFQDLLAGGLTIQDLLTTSASIQDLLNAGQAPIDLHASGILIDSLYGKMYAGGLLFYLDTLDIHPTFEGLVSSTMDQSTGTEWGCFETPITGADSTGIGEGNENTNAIVLGCGTMGIAAELCFNLSLNTFDDWFLPSKDELNEMYTKIGPGAVAPLTNIGGFTDAIYWTSTEIDADAAWRQFFFNGAELPGGKGNALVSVRAIRAF